MLCMLGSFTFKLQQKKPRALFVVLVFFVYVWCQVEIIGIFYAYVCGGFDGL